MRSFFDFCDGVGNCIKIIRFIVIFIILLDISEKCLAVLLRKRPSEKTSEEILILYWFDISFYSFICIVFMLHIQY